MSDEYEKSIALYEAERNRAWHSWFAARGYISPSDEHTRIFDGGFRMAWELCRAQPDPGAEALLSAAKIALDEMRHTIAPRDSFTNAVDALDAAIAHSAGRGEE